MARMTKEERAERKSQSARDNARLNEARAAAVSIVRSGKCPDCGRGLRANLSITGWFQCEQSGAVGFRKFPGEKPCSFQCFTQ